MQEYAMANTLETKRSEPGKNLDQYYSVEIPIDGLNVTYQFKIWDIESRCLFVLVKEISDILPWLNVGDRFIMKYYSTDSSYPYQNLDTEIHYIIKQDQGRLKGHFLIGFEIMESKGQDMGHWPYHFHRTQILPSNALLKGIYAE